MPQLTREQFEQAAREAVKTAPKGLSPEAFKAHILNTVSSAAPPLPAEEPAQTPPQTSRDRVMARLGQMNKRSGELRQHAVEHPIATAVEIGLAAAPVGIARIAKAIPTRAKAGAKFQQVMGKVGDQSIDVSRPGDAALRIQELAERGASRPKVVFDFLKRATDPTKGEPTYQEMRDFYSNISRLSADEMKRLNPVVRMELGKMRVALDRALATTAAKGGMENVYRDAMRQYAIASRMRELSEKALKYGAGLVGAGAAVKVASELTGR